jgi:hypothetical protein
MRPLLILGLLLIILGIVALVVPGITYFTTERVADVGFFRIEVSKPHTIIFNPIVGLISLAVGVFLVLAGRRTA